MCICDGAVFWNFEMSLGIDGRRDLQVFDLEILEILGFVYRKLEVQQPKIAIF